MQDKQKEAMCPLRVLCESLRFTDMNSNVDVQGLIFWVGINKTAVFWQRIGESGGPKSSFRDQPGFVPPTEMMVILSSVISLKGAKYFHC